MNEVTVSGNVTATPVLHTNERSNRVAVTFSLAVNDRYFDKQRNEWLDKPPVFHRVVCFHDQLARNAAATIQRGMAVTVTGHFADDSWADDAGVVRQQIRLVVVEIAVSLRFATAAVTRTVRHLEAVPSDPHTSVTGDGETAPDEAQAAQPVAV